ncbi:ABC transporter substrate-binding protein [Paenibacillus maysiensis]|uniref:ABC transporter substrate-binding protein n=1 Tax=Paenibacillus maysiensis TaxID=1155954 RepID=UPI000471EACC|nr:extracellular solute-binding protein [Paenibacillus maysiensis]
MKTVRWLVLYLAFLTMISGCSGPLSSESQSSETNLSNEKKITLTLWYWNRSIDDELLARAEKQFPGIELNTQKIGGDFKAKLKTTLAARSGEPDIVALNDWMVELFPSADRFYDLRTLGADQFKNQYLEWKWNQGITPDGKMIAFPMDTGPTALFYRSDLFAQAGLPSDPEKVSATIRTWDDYMAAGEQLQQKLGSRSFLADNIVNVYNQVLAQHTNLYFKPDGSYIGNQSPHIRLGWQTAVAFHRKHLLANADGWTPEWNASVNNGKVASFVGAVWMKQVLMEAAPDTAGKWKVARAPGGDGNLGGSFISILKSSKHPKEAFEVLTWLQNPEHQLEAYQKIGLFPSTPGVYDDPVMETPEPFFGGQATGLIFAASARNVKSSYFGERYPVIHGIVTRRLANVAKQNADPDALWTETMDRIERELQR